MYATMIWENDKLSLLDQTLLPEKTKYIVCYDYHRVKEAIAKLEVRGAPAIGAAAAFAMVLGAKEIIKESAFLDKLKAIRDDLISARPTAVNLAWACHKLYNCAASFPATTNLNSILDKMEELAQDIYDEDIKCNKLIGKYGAEIVPEFATLITHCNAGALATCGWGTALGVIRSAHLTKKIKMVYVDETRPLLQGARLTAYELQKENIPCTLITDNMAAWTIKTKGVNIAITGADRIALNGDAANKIGTYGLALICKAHNIPFYIAAPISTFDFTTATGADIPVEQRKGDEITKIGDKVIAPEGVATFNPSFDVTPNELITGIITEYGIIRAPYIESIKALQEKVKK